MTIIFLWRVRCLSSHGVQTSWSPTQPTACPVNALDAIDPNDIVVIDSVSNDPMPTSDQQVMGNPTLSSGRTVTRDVTVTTLAASTNTQDVTFPIDIGITMVQWATDGTFGGDVVSLHVGPNAALGFLAAPALSAATAVTVDSDVLASIEVGMYVTLREGPTSNDLDRVTAIDSVASTITVETATTDSFSADTASVESTVRLVDAWTLTGAAGTEVPVGRCGKCNVHKVDAGTTVRLIYTNNGGVTRTFSAHVEYLFGGTVPPVP